RGRSRFFPARGREVPLDAFHRIRSNSTLDRLSIGLGMIPRGEVGLIFANLGLGLVVRGERIMDQAAYSAVVLMVMATTLVTPLALKWSFALAMGQAARDRRIDCRTLPDPARS